MTASLDRPSAQIVRVPGWPVGLHRPELLSGAVHVWHVDLDEGVFEPAIGLSPAERNRAASMLSPVRRRRWCRSRHTLRLILGVYLEAEPSALELDSSPHRKPTVRTSTCSLFPAPDLHFNISHSGPHALMAFSRAGEVGIDAEEATRRFDAVRVCRRLWGCAIERELRTLEPREFSREMLRSWVRHEAVKKHAGDLWRAATPRALIDLDLDTPTVGAIAIDDHPTELSYWRWPRTT